MGTVVQSGASLFLFFLLRPKLWRPLMNFIRVDIHQLRINIVKTVCCSSWVHILLEGLNVSLSSFYRVLCVDAILLYTWAKWRSLLSILIPFWRIHIWLESMGFVAYIFHWIFFIIIDEALTHCSHLRIWLISFLHHTKPLFSKISLYHGCPCVTPEFHYIIWCSSWVLICLIDHFLIWSHGLFI